MSTVKQPMIVINDQEAFLEGLAKHMSAQSDGEAGADRLRVEGAAQVMDYIDIVRVPKEHENFAPMTSKFYEYVGLFFD